MYIFDTLKQYKRDEMELRERFLATDMTQGTKNEILVRTLFLNFDGSCNYSILYKTGGS